MINKKAHVGLIEVGTDNLPKWLLYPLIILICFVLLAVVFFMSIVGYSCLKGNCNAYYGMRWFGYYSYPFMTTSMSQTCFVNNVQVNYQPMNWWACN
jgi:hypothetical protein